MAYVLNDSVTLAGRSGVTGTVIARRFAPLIYTVRTSDGEVIGELLDHHLQPAPATPTDPYADPSLEAEREFLETF